MNLGNHKPHQLRSKHAQCMKWSTVLGELVDNSLDAGAQNVRISFGRGGSLDVVDDGRGCDNIERMLTIGDHYATSSNTLGRWGVGLKDAACWMWGELHIVTTCGGLISRAYVDWEKLACQDDWHVADPLIRPSDSQSGTTLKFSGIVRSFPDYAKTQEELGYIFAPAIWSGRNIWFGSQRKESTPITAWQMPEIVDCVDEQFSVNGKGVHLRAGIVPEGVANSRPGFSYIHGHRVIESTAYGSNGMSVSRICAIVELDGSWMLSTNKTAVSDTDSGLLAEEIFKRCEGILSKSAQQSQVIENSALENEISKSLRTVLAERIGAPTLKAKRSSPSNPTGPVEPRESGRRHTTAARTQPGSSIAAKCDVSRIRMEFKELGDSVLGDVDLPGGVINLNLNNSRIKQHRDSGNMDAIVDICITLFLCRAFERQEIDKFPQLRDYSGIIEVLSHAMHSRTEAAL